MAVRNNALYHNILAIMLLLCIATVRSMTQTFLTDDDFNRDDEEGTTYLTDQDFLNINKYHISHSTDGFGSRRILSTQRFYRGDIRGKAAWKRSQHPAGSRIRHNGVTSHIKKWGGAKIPYVLSTEYSERERAIIARAFQDYHTRTCIRFVPRSAGDRDYLYIGKIDGCFSDVGRAGRRQELSLDNGCLHHDTIIHELMHSVGFYHEHERWDRDRFITILWSNIDREAYDQFGRVDLTESSYYGQPYDYFSIMHYDNMAFSKNGLETLNAKVSEMTKVIGSALNFSPIDLEKINRMYQCHAFSNFPSSNLASTPTTFLTNNNVRAMAFADAAPTLGRRFNTINSQPRVSLFGTVTATNFRSLSAKTVRPMKDPTPLKTLNNKATPLMKGTCSDTSALCPLWSDRCNADFFAATMQEYCPLSCGLCEEMMISDVSSSQDTLPETIVPTDNVKILESFSSFSPSVNQFPVIVNAPIV